MPPLISVIIPLYNKENTIVRAVNSVLFQSYDDYEIIVVDDGSTDSSIQNLRFTQDPRISIITQDNQGVSAARNTGISTSKGDLIAFLDADDEWIPRHLETIIQLYKKYPNVGAYTTSYLMVNPEGKVIQPNYSNIPIAPFEGPIPNYFRTLAEGDPPICSSTACIPKNIFSEIGMFPVGETTGEDLDMWGRIALKFEIVFSWSIGAFWYIGSNKPFYLEEEPFLKTAKKALSNSQVNKAFLPYIERYIERKTIECATNNISTGDFQTARALLKGITSNNYYKTRIFWLMITILPPKTLPFLRKLKEWFSINQ